MRWRLHKIGAGPFPSDLVRRRTGPPKPPPAYTLADLRKVHPNSHKRWTAEEDERLALRTEEGATVPQLMEEFERNENTIITRLAKLAPDDSGTTPPPW